MIRDKVKDIVQKAVEELGFSADLPAQAGGVVDATSNVVQRPAQPEHGDFSTNIALQLGDDDVPRVAEKVAEEIEKTEVKNGFVNIFLVQDAWRKELIAILEKRENYAHLRLGGEKTVNVEFISANPTGQMHTGNGRGLFLCF